MSGVSRWGLPSLASGSLPLPALTVSSWCFCRAQAVLPQMLHLTEFCLNVSGKYIVTKYFQTKPILLADIDLLMTTVTAFKRQLSFKLRKFFSFSKY